MRISCPSCQSSYKIADEKVRGRTVKVRCRKCGITIHVNEQGVMHDGASAAPSPDGAADPGGVPQFSVLVAEGDQRDMGLQEIVGAYNSGVITADTFVWAEGQPDWMPLGEIPAIIEALTAASEAVDKAAVAAETPFGEAPDLADPAVPEPSFAPPGVSAAPAEPAPEPSPMPPFAQPEPSPAPAALFGGAPALPADPVGVSPLFGGSPGAAVQHRHENKADLFGAQALAGTDDDVATSAPQMQPAPGGQLIGSRDESSVLFSLSALTSASASVSGSAGTADGDDSGLIDLRALKSDEGVPSPSALPTGGILDSAPLLGTAIDLNLHQLKASDPPPASSNKGMIIGIAVGALGILSAVVVAVLFLTQDPPPPPPVPVAPTETDTPAIPTITTPVSTGSAAAPATGAPSATAAPTKVGGGRYVGGGKPATTKGGTTTTGGGGTPPAATTKKPPKSKCNCPPGDLACNMACAVK